MYPIRRTAIYTVLDEYGIAIRSLILKRFPSLTVVVQYYYININTDYYNVCSTYLKRLLGVRLHVSSFSIFHSPCTVPPVQLPIDFTVHVPRTRTCAYRPHCYFCCWGIREERVAKGVPVSPCTHTESGRLASAVFFSPVVWSVYFER